MPDINVNKLSEILNTKADIDLNNTGVFSTSEGGVVNLTSSTPANANGKEVTSADFIKSDIQSNLLNYTTNRILEIPQDIKLELNNGTLTLKAGSKVYVPNGFEANGTTPKFDVIITTQDVTGLEWFSTSTLKNQMVFVRTDGLGIDSTVYTSSGTSYPSSPSNGDRCYRTDLNLLYTFRAANNQWTLEDCLPIAIVQPSSTEAGKTSSIDQVFNGFGYIGSTLFALPGVKVQTPNGKNENGTYKNVEYATESVRTMDVSGWGTGFYGKLIFGDQFIIQPDVRFHTKTDGVLWTFKDNQWYADVNGTVTKRYIVFVGNVHISSGKVSSLDLYDVDSIANSNASNFSQAGRSYLSGLGMPSNSMINPTVLASGSSYTAPANGCYSVMLTSNTNSRALVLLTNTSSQVSIGDHSYSSGTSLRCFVPCKKGDSIELIYEGGTITAFIFVYAQGEK